jgi:hypothetical protein
VVLNARRWLLDVDSYGSDLINHQRYLLNDEFGHALAKHHLDCPGPGRLAPVMMQQTKGIGACTKARMQTPPFQPNNAAPAAITRMEVTALGVIADGAAQR